MVLALCDSEAKHTIFANYNAESAQVKIINATSFLSYSYERSGDNNRNVAGR